jgi:hypothetical protein
MSAITSPPSAAPAASPRPATGEGVTFPVVDGTRSTSATGRAILADAARAADPGLAARIADARSWRSEYVPCVRELTAACCAPDAAVAVAEAGLAALRRRMVVDRGDDGERALVDALRGPAGLLERQELHGDAAPAEELRIPYRGGELHGAALREQLERWVAAGVAEPSFATAIERVAEHPEWLALPGRTVALLGAGAEMGPLAPLTAWGARVAAVDVPRPDVQARIAATAGRGAGTVVVPVGPDGTPGVDLVRGVPETRAWLDEAAGPDHLVLGTYAYADGGLHVRVSAAADALAADLLDRRPGTALAYLATPTDAFVVPEEVVATARRAWAARGARRIAQAPLRAVSRGRLYAPAYADGRPVADVLVEQQGPNYALAKRVQRWRGVAARRAGHLVSFNVAPASWTRSVTKNRMLAAAYAGAHRFGVEVFAPETARTLMAALLVHDLHAPAPAAGAHPEALFSDAAMHGGLWRAAYDPRSVLGLAAVTGLPSALRRR